MIGHKEGIKKTIINACIYLAQIIRKLCGPLCKPINTSGSRGPKPDWLSRPYGSVKSASSWTHKSLRSVWFASKQQLAVYLIDRYITPRTNVHLNCWLLPVRGTYTTAKREKHFRIFSVATYACRQVWFCVCAVLLITNQLDARFEWMFCESLWRISSALA